MSFKTRIEELQSRLSEIADETDALGTVAESENRDLSDDDLKMIDTLSAEYEEKEAILAKIQKAAEVSNKAHADRLAPQPMGTELAANAAGVLTAAKLPVRVKGSRSRFYDSTEDCFAMGQWLGAIVGKESSREWCDQNGITIRNAMEEGTDTLGGYSVPSPMAATIIRLIEEYGVYRANSRNVTMPHGNLSVPKRDAGLTVYYPAEGDPITPSDLTFGQVALSAKKYATISLLSTELNEDSVISMTDLVTQEIAWAIAVAEDTNSFLGDGTGTYGGVTGIASALAAGAKVTASGVNWGAVALTDFEQMVAKCPQYTGINPKWYMNSYAYYTAAVPLLTALGGTDMRQAEEGGGMRLLGYPVEFTQCLPGSAAGTGDFAAVFGDLSMGSYLGNTRNLTIRILNELYAASDQIGIQATSRSDSVIYSVGDATTAGSIVGLEMA